MAIQTNIIDTFTELYVDGGGYLTQSYPTNFHQFYKRKMLTATEKIEDFKEVTEAEKTKLEASDAAWERPPQSFINQWNVASEKIGTFNEETGYFELNGIVDIDYNEALRIYQYKVDSPNLLAASLSGINTWNGFRTNLITFNTRYASMYSLSGLCNNNSYIEALCLSKNLSQGICVNEASYFVSNTPNLKRIYPTIVDYGITTNGAYDTGNWGRAFWGCKALEDVKINGIRVNIDFKDSPNLSYDSINYIIKNAKNTSNIWFKAHPNVFAKLTDENNTDWHQILLDATEKNITFIAA